MHLMMRDSPKEQINRSSALVQDGIPLFQIMANLTSEDFVRDTLSRINDSFTQPIDYYGPSFEFNNSGTAHLSVVAPDGSAVALTSTINW